MDPSLSPAEPAPATRPGPGRIVAGLALMIVWAGAHVVLFYLVAIAGVLAEWFLLLAKAIMFPGASQSASAPSFTWDWLLRAGAIVSGAGGVPAGLAVIWRHRRKVLMRYVWLALLAGLVCAVIAFGTFIAGALSVPSA